MVLVADFDRGSAEDRLYRRHARPAAGKQDCAGAHDKAQLTPGFHHIDFTDPLQTAALLACALGHGNRHCTRVAASLKIKLRQGESFVRHVAQDPPRYQARRLATSGMDSSRNLVPTLTIESITGRSFLPSSEREYSTEGDEEGTTARITTPYG
jgi:hypothetical protein